MSMEGLFGIIPGSVPIEIDGQLLRLAPLTLGHYAEIERRLLSARRSSLHSLRETVVNRSEPMPKEILQRAFDDMRRGDRVSREELAAWFRSDEGVLFELWLRLRRMQPRLTLAEIQERFGKRANEISETMAIASESTGEYPPGKLRSCGRASMHPAAANRFLGTLFSAV
jgi:hypothetical protein